MRAHPPLSLNVIRIQNPCPADWNAMHGDERVRFCDECKLHVYNLSELTRAQADRLVAKHEGRLCVRFYQRADGTVITRDCEGGLRRAIQRTRRVATLVASALFCAVLAPFGLGSNVPKGSCELTETPTIPTPPRQPEIMGKIAVMGDVAPVPMMGGIQAPPRQLMGEVGPRTPATQPTTQRAE